MIVATKYSDDSVHPVSVRFTAEEVATLHQVLSYFALNSDVEDLLEKRMTDFLTDMDWVAEFVEERDEEKGDNDQ